ncbi:MAG TPA: hypothetical protein PLE19_20500 [Planctomycetota bacterium]|nr:hypothetical protein [Planctomycetota bacterium]HRR81863.1 hypothetical protein [Planctomycetota bacterium]HRT97666.1 hypothetical protein [Planctomycetota bacterium]
MAPVQDEAARADTEAMIQQLMLARNGDAVRELAQRRRLSKSDVAALVRRILEEQERLGTEDRLGPRYDIHSGKYLSLAEWAQQFLRG